MNDSNTGIACFAVVIIIAVVYMSGFIIGKNEGYRNGYLTAYEHIAKEIKKIKEEQK